MAFHRSRSTQQLELLGFELVAHFTRVTGSNPVRFSFTLEPNTEGLAPVLMLLQAHPLLKSISCRLARKYAHIRLFACSQHLLAPGAACGLGC
jgi:hypothetical protein